MSSAARMPAHVGVRFAHAAVQAIADSVGVDVLHIKGPAVDPNLLETVSRIDEAGAVHQVSIERQSLDADVLVRPDQVDTLLDAMCRHGWVLRVDFVDGSAFEHAATMGHPLLAPVDVHRRFPGFGEDADRVFRTLWRDKQTFDIAGRSCVVPHLIAQRLLLLLNAVRGGPARRAEIDRLWSDASPQDRQAVEQLAAETGAQVALAAAVGNLADHRGSREHDLWWVLSTGQDSLLSLWLARVRAQPSARSALREAVRLVVPNPRRLAFTLGRPLSRREIAAAWAERIGEGIRALSGAAMRRAGRGNR